MAIEVQLTQKLSQQLLITAQLKQALKILSLNNLDLVSEIQQQLNENPVLEIAGEQSKILEKEPKSDESETEIVWFDSGAGTNPDSRDWYENIAEEQSLNLKEHLSEQICIQDLTKLDKKIFECVINNISDNGYLTIEPVLIARLLDCPVSAVEKIYTLVKTLEPAGIGAADLQECLLIQLDRLGFDTKSLEYRIVKNCLTKFANRSFRAIQEELNCTKEQILTASKTIKNLSPHPLHFIAAENAQTLIPDVKLVEDNGKWKVRINEENLPNLAISEYYLFLINNNLYQSATEKKFLSKKFKEAGWFLQAIYQRNDTMRKVAEEILNIQKDFLLTGLSNLQPLVLREIATRLDIHESTVSRAVNDKYIETPQGIFPLKAFFSSKIKNSKTGVSANSIKTKLEAIIERENPSKPYSDQKIVEIFASDGLTVARRTIAKYRKELKIPSARMRKKI